MKTSYSPRHANRRQVEGEGIEDYWKNDTDIDLSFYRLLFIGIGVGIILSMIRIFMGGNGFDRDAIQLLALPICGCTAIWVVKKIYLEGFKKGRNDG